MSQRRPWGRSTPRWSLGGQVEFAPASIAALPFRRASVFVGPPLSASSARSGSFPRMSDSRVKAQLLEGLSASYSRLWPSDRGGVPPQFRPSVGLATIVFFAVAEAGAPAGLAPSKAWPNRFPPSSAPFPLTVTLRRLSWPIPVS